MSRHFGQAAAVVAYTAFVLLLGAAGGNWTLTRLLLEGVRLNREAADRIEELVATVEDAEAWVSDVLPELAACRARVAAEGRR